MHQFCDYPVIRRTTDPTTVKVIEGTICGIGLTGVCPTGSCLIVGRRESSDTLERIASGYGFNVFLSYPDQFPMGVIAVLFPGDVYWFDEPMSGISVLFRTFNGAIVAPEPWDGTAALSSTVLNSAPVLRVFNTPQTVDRLSFAPSGGSQLMPHSYMSTGSGDPGSSKYGVFIPPGVKTVWIQMLDDAGTEARIVGSESGTYEVWWQLVGSKTLLWANNPYDNWTAGYKEAASGSHDIESYNVNGCVQRVVLAHVSGNDFAARIAWM